MTGAVTRAASAATLGIELPNHRTHEVVLALLIALCMPLGASIALRANQLHKLADAPSIVALESVPIRIKPVIDLESPLLKLGGEKKKFKLPDMWAPPPEPVVKKRVTRKAFVSPKAKDEVEEIPPADIAIADAGTEPPEPDADLIKEQEAEATEDSDAGAVAEGPGSPDGVVEGTEADPLKARAKRHYHDRIVAFFRRRFQVPNCTEEMAQKSVPWSATLVGGGQVASCQVSPSGDAALDGPAQAACQSAMGQTIPPPENYPHLGGRTVGGIFKCRAK